MPSKRFARQDQKSRVEHQGSSPGAEVEGANTDFDVNRIPHGAIQSRFLREGARRWQSNVVFHTDHTVTSGFPAQSPKVDYNTAKWSGGSGDSFTLELADSGNSYTINPGDTGDMSGPSFVFWGPDDPNEFRVTTDFQETIGDERILIATAKPNPDLANAGTSNIDPFFVAAVPVGDTFARLTTGQLSANSISASLIQVVNLQSLSTFTGTLQLDEYYKTTNWNGAINQNYELTTFSTNPGIVQTTKGHFEFTDGSGNYFRYDGSSFDLSVASSSGNQLEDAQKVAELASESQGEVTSIDVKNVTSRQPTGKHLMVLNASSEDIVEIILDEDLQPGDNSVDIQAQRVNAPADSRIVASPPASSAEVTIAPSRIQTSLETGRQGTALAELSNDVSGNVNSFDVDYLDASLDENDILYVINRITGDSTKIYLTQSEASSTTQKTINFDDGSGGAVTLNVPEGSSLRLSDEFTRGSFTSITQDVSDNAASVVLKAGVSSGKINELALVELSASVSDGSAITLAADQVNIEGVAVFSNVSSGDSLNDTTTINGSTITTGVINDGDGNMEMRLDDQELWFQNRTFGSDGIQLQYNSGSPRFHIGNFSGGGDFLRFLTSSGDLEISGVFRVSDIVEDILLKDPGRITNTGEDFRVDHNGFTLTSISQINMGSPNRVKWITSGGSNVGSIGTASEGVMAIDADNIVSVGTGGIDINLNGYTTPDDLSATNFPTSDQSDAETVWVDSNGFLKIST